MAKPASIARRRALAAMTALLAAPSLAQEKKRAVIASCARRAPMTEKRDSSSRLVESLRRRGYEAGRNLVLEQRFADARSSACRRSRASSSRCVPMRSW
jgi:hypothetical protein